MYVYKYSIRGMGYWDQGGLRQLTVHLTKHTQIFCEIHENNKYKDVRFNRIYDIAPGVFSHLHRLRSLLLNDNQLRELRSGCFHGLRRLKYLYLYRNRIQHIDSDVFHGMAHLEQLYLHVNEIHQIEPETFSNLPRLERLYLHNNNLKTIPPGSFRGMPKLQKLRLDSNALNCDCGMLWFIRMLAEHNQMSIAATCYEPAGATGTSLAAMKENDFHCRLPEIKSNPEDVVVNFGEDAMFTCNATGEPTPEIIWYRDSSVLPIDNSRYEIMNNGTLMIHNADVNDVAVFECKAKNPAGEVLSKPAKMMVQMKPDDNGYPIFTTLPRNQIVKMNQPITRIDCVAHGNPKPHISWYFKDERILLSDRISMRHNGSIIIENVQLEDSGLYTCQAENINGKITAAVILEVMVAPAFVVVPKDQTVTIGDTAQFMCSARGVPKPVITWYRNTMEARKIVGAQMQVITYVHWLPLILGPEGYEQLGEYKEYNANLNPSISNVFATAALRFGHSIINPILHRYDENFEPIPQGHLLLRNAFFSPWRLVDEGGVDPLLRGMFITPAKLKTSTQNLNSELTEKLFHTAHAVALDLAAINIQRSRDHGIPPYTKWRQVCNMSEVNDFEDLSNEISDKNVRDKLRELYGSVHNIDVWVGGILEDQVEGGKVGPLFRCLLIEQFKRLRDGDRFWYENPSTFKPEQLRQIKKTNLARVLCDNGDNIDTISENVFLLPEVQDGLVSCEDLPSIDLRFWTDCESCGNDILGTESNRVRRDVSSDADLYTQLTENDHRINTLEDSHTELEKTIVELKKEIQQLKETCQKN
ncbi:unnamed protein product [Euphydryas editha]|uniref:Hemolin n=1 Tax=Euphydryas editha TaxID=104508 RepID=A0AAU9V1C4_EUPED|nr:unnamed protein product [Euphydryas editha]